MHKTVNAPHGHLTHNGITLFLQQEAYIANAEHYTADAFDADGNDYEITWPITHTNISECEDESLACDWKIFTVRKL